MWRLRKWLKHIGLILSVIALSIPGRVLAQTVEWNGVCVGGADQDVATIQGLECLIANVFTVFITLLGLLGFVMFIIAGFKWMTSGGNSKGMESARGAMTYAVLGLVISLSAFIIINLIAEFTGVNIIRTFSIPTSDLGM